MKSPASRAAACAGTCWRRYWHRRRSCSWRCASRRPRCTHSACRGAGASRTSSTQCSMPRGSCAAPTLRSSLRCETIGYLDNTALPWWPSG
ncbi:Uncharacterised protein [Bordetella pertussis]|nr:Uncharacterised protein [Bordetella pertussis]